MIQEKILNSQSPVTNFTRQADFVNPMDLQMESPLYDEPIYDTNVLKNLSSKIEANNLTELEGVDLSSEELSEQIISELKGKLQNSDESNTQDKSQDDLTKLFII